MSIGLLRFLSTFQYLGQLVIIIFAMSQDLGAFLFVFLMSILGFGIAFHSLFPDREEFQGLGSTFLTLFNAALGDHNFGSFQSHKYQLVGVPAMGFYAMFVTIILLNLIIAQMSSTFEKMNEKSFEQWSMVMAKNVQDWLMISEKSNPMCMVPPPLNALTMLFFPLDWWERQRNRAKEEIPSVCGTVSDFTLGLLTAPICAALEVYLVNAELWTSQIPRINAVLMTILSVGLFPLWYLLYLIVVLHNMYSMDRITVSRRTNRIIYKQANNVDPTLRKWIMLVVFFLFSPFWFIYFFHLALKGALDTYKAKLLKRKADHGKNNSGIEKKAPLPGPAFYNRRASSFKSSSSVMAALNISTKSDLTGSIDLSDSARDDGTFSPAPLGLGATTIAATNTTTPITTTNTTLNIVVLTHPPTPLTPWNNPPSPSLPLLLLLFLFSPSSTRFGKTRIHQSTRNHQSTRLCQNR